MSFLQFHFSFTPCSSAIGICAWSWTLKPLYLGQRRTRVGQQRALGWKQGAGGEEAWLEDRTLRTDFSAGYPASSILGCLHWSCNNRQHLLSSLSVPGSLYYLRLVLAQSKKQAPPSSPFYWGGTSIPKWVAFPHPYVIQVTDPSSVSRQSSTSDLTDPPSAPLFVTSYLLLSPSEGYQDFRNPSWHASSLFFINYYKV